MSSNVLAFEFRGKAGMKAITSDASKIGARVRQANVYKVGTIVGANEYGYIVIFEDGDERQSQTFGALSPFGCITETDEPADSAERVAELLQLRDAKRVQDRRDQEAEAREKVLATERFVEELREKYPNRAPEDGKLSGPARAAANLRAELKATFPGIKFSVKSSSYSMGSSININWDFGPTVAAVREISAKFSDRSFDGMTDSTIMNNSAYGRAVDIVLDRAGYVHEYRRYSELFAQVKGTLAGHFANDDSDSLDVERTAQEMLSRTTFPAKFEFAGVVYNETTFEFDIVFK